MIDEKTLDCFAEYHVLDMSGIGIEDKDELFRLARLGLWAEKYGIKTIKAAKQMHGDLCEHLSEGEYKIEELQKPFDIGAPLYDGLMASYGQEITEALAAIPNNDK